jgi:hypothetical protein
MSVTEKVFAGSLALMFFAAQWALFFYGVVR